ncbi:interaptin-like isoform X1 [Clytia hemisphaerica]|uniref:Uncharacterized protein n=1 Tax=Clytia hemisphaerica TaxID=252671 RepID=A0A7M5VB00_9CNID
MRGPNQQKRLGAVDINIPNILVHEDGIFKALLTTTCKQQPLPCQPDGEIFTEPSEGKVLTDKWQLSGERNQIFHNDQNGTFKIELTKQLVGQPILLHATLLRYDEAKVVPQVSDGFVVHSQGTVQIYPRKKLFDSDKTIVGAKHSIKLKLSSNLENEMVRVASGWLELFVDVSIFQEAKEQAPKTKSSQVERQEKKRVKKKKSRSPSKGEKEEDNTFELSSMEVSEVRKMIHSDPVNESNQRQPTPVVVKEFIRDKNQIGRNKKDTFEHVSKKKDQITSSKEDDKKSHHKQDKNEKTIKINRKVEDVVNKEVESSQRGDEEEEVFEAPRIYFPVSNKPSPSKQQTDLNKKQAFKHSPLFTRKPLPVRVLRGNVKQKGDLIEEEEEENEPPYPLMRDESPVMPPPTNKLDNDVTRIDSPATGMVKEESHFNLPGLNAVRELLPKYHSLSTNEEEQRNRKARKYSVEPHVPIKEPPSKDSGDEFDQQFRDTRQQTYLNPNLDVMITYQWKEIERLKDCCNKMADDIRQQRQEILKLGHEKSQLSHQLAVARTEGINEDTNSVVGQLRSQLIMESKEKIELQERVNNLQNEIIQKNEVEEKYLQLQTAHEEQQKTLHDLQIKNAEVNRMKLNIQKQEKIIQLLEQENGQMARTGKPNKQSEKNSNSSKSRDQEKSVAMVTENIQQIDDQLKMVRELEEAHHTIAMLKDHLERVEREQHYSNVKSFYERKSLPYGYGNQRPSIMAANSMQGRFHQSPYTQHNWRNEQRDSNSLQRYSYNFGKRIGGGGGKYQH